MIGARVAAAALVAGLSLLGPQVCGVAVADSAEDAESTASPADAGSQSVGKSGASRSSRLSSRASVSSERSVSARVAGSRQPAAVGPGRASATAAEPEDSGEGLLSGVGSGSPGIDVSERASLLGDVVDGGAESALTGVTRSSAVVARPVASDRVGRVSVTGLAPAADETGSLPAAAAGLDQAVGELSAAVVGLIDGLRAVLSGLPANPVSEFLSGALYLVRRSLRPVGAGVGLFGSVPCVGSGDCSGLDLSGADLSGRILAGLSFARAVLDGVDFSGADLSRADLSLAALRQADLTDANLFEANLAGADLVGADLDGVTNFATATLTGADLSGQILLRLDLSDKDLTDTDFSGAILTGSDLSGADLGQADFEGAKLARVDLSGVDLSGANLDSADLGDVIWGDTPCPDGVECETPDSGSGDDAVDTGLIDQGLLGSDPSIATNPNFSYADAIVAGRFSDLAYNLRSDSWRLKREIGWRGIVVPQRAWAPGGFSPSWGGYSVKGVQDGMEVQSFAWAGRRLTGDGTTQFIFAVEGSNKCGFTCLIGYPGDGEEREDWDANLRQFGWSRYYASLQPLMAEVLRQMIDVQKGGKKAQLIITGHSLGGATAMIAYADLLAPKGDLYPLGQTNVLADGKRIWDKIADWTPATIKAVQDATTVYTFGAPSPLIDPVKEPGGINAVILGLSISTFAGIWKAFESLNVRDETLPEPFRGGTVWHNPASNRVFQFEHTGERSEGRVSDIVATLGSRDPGYRFEIRLRPDIHDGYAGGSYEAKGGISGVSYATHDIGLYNESLIRLLTWNALLADSTPVEDVVGTPTSGDQGSDQRNDVFLKVNGGQGKAGNDWYFFTRISQDARASFSADGGMGNDLYALDRFVALTIDGARQAGSDGLIFNDRLGGDTYREAPQIKVETRQSGSSLTAVYLVTNNPFGPKIPWSVTVKNWDEWTPSDVYVLDSSDRWKLNSIGALANVGPRS